MAPCDHGRWVARDGRIICAACGVGFFDDVPVTAPEFDALTDHYRRQGRVPVVPPRVQ